ncbi:hypothetical protein ILUMI_27074 [Ignelater luminosus]|uniref:Uncharacterized protein n=1 Tax=Ignelater luminosus TaxID=2038154 RepID=A0A8K0C790_IGNLU|nr:hypothetical protein ILUMI_27074 [Ignelater luminosus]
MEIFALSRICSLAWDRVASSQNIKSGFRAIGISPFDSDIFKDIDFMSSFVSDRETHPVASTSAAVRTTNHSAQVTPVSPQKGNFPMDETSTAAIPAQLSLENTMLCLVSPEDITSISKRTGTKGVKSWMSKRKVYDCH